MVCLIDTCQWGTLVDPCPSDMCYLGMLVDPCPSDMCYLGMLVDPCPSDMCYLGMLVDPCPIDTCQWGTQVNRARYTGLLVLSGASDFVSDAFSAVRTTQEPWLVHVRVTE